MPTLTSNADADRDDDTKIRDLLAEIRELNPAAFAHVVADIHRSGDALAAGSSRPVGEAVLPSTLRHLAVMRRTGVRQALERAETTLDIIAAWLEGTGVDVALQAAEAIRLVMSALGDASERTEEADADEGRAAPERCAADGPSQPTSLAAGATPPVANGKGNANGNREDRARGAHRAWAMSTTVARTLAAAELEDELHPDDLQALGVVAAELVQELARLDQELSPAPGGRADAA